jgi:hypothetical protein
MLTTNKQSSLGTQVYNFTLNPIFAFIGCITRQIIYNIILYCYVVPLRALVTVLFLPFKLGADLHTFKNASIKDKCKLTFTDKLKNKPILKACLVNIILLPLIPLMILKPVKALVALGASRQLHENFLILFNKILYSSNTLKEINNPSNHQNYYDNCYQGKSAVERIKQAWNANSYEGMQNKIRSY